MDVAVGRRVDQCEEAFGASSRRVALVAILRADVDGRLRRKPPAEEDIVEFGFVIVGKEDVVADQAEAGNFRDRRPRYGR